MTSAFWNHVGLHAFDSELFRSDKYMLPKRDPVATAPFLTSRSPCAPQNPKQHHPAGTDALGLIDIDICQSQ